jgi:hypothetical protein
MSLAIWGRLPIRDALSLAYRVERLEPISKSIFDEEPALNQKHQPQTVCKIFEKVVVQSLCFAQVEPIGYRISILR